MNLLEEMIMERIKLGAIAVLFLIFINCTGKETGTYEFTSSPVSSYQSGEVDTAYFASGCFWCTEAVFERVEGVLDVVSGYSGGQRKNPNYKEVSAGLTNHAEAVRVVYNPSVVSYPVLVEVFFGSHDPTTLNRQGPDVGKQYRSAIFYRSADENKTAVDIKNRLDKDGRFKDPIVTEITAFTAFYHAEDYHQNYYELHPNQPYILSVSKPKVEKFKKQFKKLLKEQYK